MKNRVFLTVIALAFSVSLFAQPEGWEWKSTKKGVQYGSIQVKMFDSNQSIAVVRYPASKAKVNIVNDPGFIRRYSATTVSRFGKRYSGEAVINGSYFNTKTLFPTTYVRDHGKVEGKTADNEKVRTDGMFAVNGHKLMVVPNADTLALKSELDKAKDVMAAGPVLIKNGAIIGGWPMENGFFSNRHPRSVIGVGADGYVYMIVIDGRHPDNADGASIPETAEIAKLFGLKDAINLDGGGSSALWVKNVGIISHPSDNKSYDEWGERTVPNAIILK